MDVRMKTSRHLFDGRDPAPFRERALDEDAIEYLEESAAELPTNAPMKLVFWISEEPEPHLAPEIIVQAIMAHFTHEQEKLSHRMIDYFKRAKIFMLVGVCALAVFLTLSELSARVQDPHVQKILHEGFVIMGWVAMWRPLEVWLYDWWPLLLERRRLKRMLRAPVEVHFSAGPTR